MDKDKGQKGEKNLQYTLLLLILKTILPKLPIIIDLQYTLLLLIRYTDEGKQIYKYLFTIHFATINTYQNMTEINL